MRRVSSLVFFWAACLAGVGGAVLLQLFWMDEGLQGRIVNQFTLDDPLAFAPLLFPVAGVLAALAVLGYLISLDPRAKGRPFVSMAAGFAGPGALAAAAGYWFTLEEFGNPALGWLSAAGGALAGAVLILAVELFFRWFWDRALRSMDQKNLGGPALLVSRIGLLWRPGQDRLLRAVAMERFRRGARGETSAMLRDLYAAGDRDADLLEMLCRLANEEGKPAEYLTYLRQLLEKFPNDEQLQEAYLDELLEQGHEEEALDAMERYGVGGEDEEALAAYASLLVAARRFPEAVQAAKRLGEVERVPMPRSNKILRDILNKEERPDVLNILASQAERTANREAQMKWLERSLALDRNQPGKRHRLIQLYEEMDYPDRLENVLAQEVEDKPQDAALALRYAHVLMSNAKADKARAFLGRKSFQEGPKDAERLEILAHAHFEMKDMDQARGAAEAALKVPGAHDAGREGRLNMLLRRVENAILSKELAELVERAHNTPADLELNLEALRALVLGGHGERAVGLADRILTNHPAARGDVANTLEYAFTKVTKAAAKEPAPEDNGGSADPKDAAAKTKTTGITFPLLDLLSDLQAEQGRYDAALETIKAMAARGMDPVATLRDASQKILRRSPHHLPTLSALGEAYRRAAMFTEMIHAYSLYLANGGEETEEISRALGEAYLVLKDYKSAKKHVSRLMGGDVVESEEATRMLHRLIPMAIDSGAADEAAEFHKLLEQRAPQDKETKRLRALVSHALDSKRFAFLQREVEGGKASYDQLMELGDLSREAEDFGQAITYYQRASRQPEASRLPLAKLAYCYAKKRLFDMAGDTLGELKLSLQDDPAELDELMGWVYQTAELLEEAHFFNRAAAMFKQLVKIDAGYKDVLNRVEKLTSR